MNKIVEQFTTGELTILILETLLPLSNFKKISIDGKEYEPEIVYDMENAIAINVDGDFLGKEIEFITQS